MEGLRLDFRVGETGQFRHRCDVSSKLCCPGAKPRRWLRHSLHASTFHRESTNNIDLIVFSAMYSTEKYVLASVLTSGGFKSAVKTTSITQKTQQATFNINCGSDISFSSKDTQEFFDLKKIWIFV